MTFKPTVAMVLAAGPGKRMHPITKSIPKPLVAVSGRTMIDRAIDRLEDYGIKKVVVNISYKGEMVKQHLAARNSPEIVFSEEESPLETGGGIKKALPLIGDEPFFVTNSDIIWQDGFENTLSRLASVWNEKAMDSMLLLTRTVTAIGYSGQGDMFLGYGREVRRKKPLDVAPYVFAGVQLMHPRLVADNPKESFPLGELLVNSKENNGWIPRVFGIPHDGIWIHVGEPESIKVAEEALS